MNQEVLAARLQSLSKTAPRRRTPPTSPRPSFADVKLRKVGDKSRGGKEDDWLSWFISSICCSGSTAADGSSVKSRQRLKTNRVECTRCRQPIFANEGYRYEGRDYHKRCFRCDECGGSLANDGIVKHKRGNGYVCVTCSVKIIDQLRRQRSGHVIGETQETAGVKNIEKADVQELLNTIGNDLEEAMRNAVPRCEICGDSLAAVKPSELEYEIVLDKRIPVAHKECRRTGRPKDGVVKSAQAPRLAIRKAPLQFVVRFTFPDNKKTITLFFKKEASDDDDEGAKKHYTKAENEQPASARYAHVPPEGESSQTLKKRTEALYNMLLDDSSFDVHVAADRDFRAVPASEQHSSGGDVVVLQALKSRLRHTLKLSFDKNTSDKDAVPTTMLLTISLLHL